MRRGLIAAFFLLLYSFFLYGEELSDLSWSVREELERFYEGIYNATDPHRIHKDYEAVREAVFSQSHPDHIKDYLSARITMLYGRHFTTEDTIWYDPGFGEKHLREALAAVEHMMSQQESAKLYALASEIRGSIFLLRPLRYLLSHGRAANSLSSQARKADETDLDVLILLGNEALYTPALYGGSPRSALAYFTSALDVFQARQASAYYPDPVSRFSIYSGIGIALKELNMPDEAAPWLEEALKIYPYNPYILQISKELPP